MGEEREKKEGDEEEEETTRNGHVACTVRLREGERINFFELEAFD